MLGSPSCTEAPPASGRGSSTIPRRRQTSIDPTTRRSPSGSLVPIANPFHHTAAAQQLLLARGATSQPHR